jgi:CHAT domain-containing protein
MQIIRIDRKEAKFTAATKKILSTYGRLVDLADSCAPRDWVAFSRELKTLSTETGKILNNILKDLGLDPAKQSNLTLALDNQTVKIPWELAYLPPKKPNAPLMYCEELGIGRLRVVKAYSWINPPDRRRTNRALVVGTNYRNTKRKIKPLSYAEDEAEKIAKILATHGFKDENIKLLKAERATKKAVLEELKKGVDLFHFTGHGIMTRNSSKICLNDKDLSAKTFEKESKNCSVPRLTFFNACESSIDTPHKNKPASVPYSWAYAIAGQGGRVFIGTLWTVWEPNAGEFAQTFYKSFLGKQRKTLAEAMKEARLETFLKENSNGNTSDNTWPGYMLYGVPTLVKRDILR